MRASRAGLILTPHRTAELGGPTSLRWHEARQLVSFPILELARSLALRVGSHGGAVDRLHELAKKKKKRGNNKGLTEGKEGDDESAISPLSCPSRRTKLHGSPVKRHTLLVQTCNKPEKRHLFCREGCLKRLSAAGYPLRDWL